MVFGSDANHTTANGKTIRRHYGLASENYTYYPLVIIGAGKSGISMGCRLKAELGFDQFRIFERQNGIGGRWWSNRHPGTTCDIPGVLYSFPFYQSSKMTTLPPSGSEIIEYFEDACMQYQLVDKIQLNTEVEGCRWLASESVWEVTLRHLILGAEDLNEQKRNQKTKEIKPESRYTHEKIRVKVLVSAVGCPLKPEELSNEIPGKDVFKGEIFHSSRWRYDIDLKDKEIIVVGTGSSAAQFVPLLIKEYEARSVTQLMRSPPWVSPLSTSPYLSDWNKRIRWLVTHVPSVGLLARYIIAIGAEYEWQVSLDSSTCNIQRRKELEEDLLEHMKKTVPKKYHEILTPNYAIQRNNRIFDNAWLSSLNNPAVVLTTLPLTHFGEQDITLGPGRTYPDLKDTSSRAPSHKVTIPADIIIFANELSSDSWTYPFEVVGQDGKKLHDISPEIGGPQMYMGTVLGGFPNFFAISGPNKMLCHSPFSLATENAINLSLKLIKPLLSNDLTTVEFKKQPEIAWPQEVQNSINNSKLISSNHDSCGPNKTGHNPILYPYSQTWLILKSMFPTWSDWNMVYTSKGLVKNTSKKALKALTITFMFWSIIEMRSVRGPFLILRRPIRWALLNSSKVLLCASQKI